MRKRTLKIIKDDIERLEIHEFMFQIIDGLAVV